MNNHFFAMLARMKYINRWALMRNIQEESICQHSMETACFAHALAVIKNKYFWINTAGFAVWPILVPKLFGAINLFYASKEFLSSFPISILVIFTVDLPFVVFSFIAWLIVTRYWSKTRMHRTQNDHKN